jgi:hypothetical protein
MYAERTKKWAVSIFTILLALLLLAAPNTVNVKAEIATPPPEEWFSSLFQQSGPSESLVSMFDHSIEATTTNTYSGYVAVEISNFGWRNINEAYDAFYWFINGGRTDWTPTKNHTGRAHRLNFDQCSYEQTGQLCGTYIGDNLPDGNKHFRIVFAEGLGECTNINYYCVPPYNPSHVYRYVLSITGSPTVLNWGFGDNAKISDNLGQYDIKITPVTPLPNCLDSSWACSAWIDCAANSTQTRSCTKVVDCTGGAALPATSQSCVYVPPTCSEWTYTNWGTCSVEGLQTRSIVASLPNGCIEGNPVLTKTCVYVPPCSSVFWECDDWKSCSSTGNQTRSCTKVVDCTGGAAPPATSQSCVLPPQISSVTPNEVNWYQYLVINGSDFEATSQNNHVFLDGFEVNVNEWSDSEIRIKVSSGIGDFFNSILDDRRIESVKVSVRKEEDAQTLNVTKSTSIGIKPVIDFVWQVPKKDHLEPGDLMYISGPLIKPGQDTIYVDDQRASWDLSNSSPVPSSALSHASYNGRAFFNLPNNLASADSIRVVTPDGIESDYKLMAAFGHGIAPPCTEDAWICDDWKACSSGGIQDRSCTKTFECEAVNTQSPETSQSCTYVPPCTEDSWSCEDWGECKANGKKTRSCTKTFDCPTANTSSPSTSQSCTYVPPCTSDTWSCGNWSECAGSGTQNRSCTKTFDCPSSATPSPGTVQACTPARPACNADVWTCGSWGECSISGIQNRSCSKSFDCPTAETAPPILAQYCQAPSRPQNQQSGSSEIVNQEAIIKATVKLLCPFDSRRASQGSGTVINSSGTILTNKHVVAGTLGCLVGFVDKFSDEPYFGNRQIAEVIRVSPSYDVALLKIRNPNNRRLVSIDVSRSSRKASLGDEVTTYGYPAKFGTKMTFTSGDFSGVDDEYIKTTAILEYGNSGGGAYLKDGTYIGIPSAVVRGELNALGYILSIDVIRAWMNNSSVASSDTGRNRYSRVSVLEDIDLEELDSLKLFIPDTDSKGDLDSPVVPTNPGQGDASVHRDDQSSEVIQFREESTVIEPEESSPEEELPKTEDQTQQEQSSEKSDDDAPWWKRFWRWLVNLFRR